MNTPRFTPFELGNQAKSRLDQHRDTFITASDFRWIKDTGLNAVRLPVGSLGSWKRKKPYVEYSLGIDFALDQCQQNDLKLLLEFAYWRA